MGDSSEIVNALTEIKKVCAKYDIKLTDDAEKKYRDDYRDKPRHFADELQSLYEKDLLFYAGVANSQGYDDERALNEVYASIASFCEVSSDADKKAR